MALRADPKGYYGILGVAPSATAEEIRVAFRDAAKRYHPDQGGEADGNKFQLLTEAYDTLRDGRRRMQYDAARIEQDRPQTHGAGSSRRRTRHFDTADLASETANQNSKRNHGGTLMMASAAGLAVALLVSLTFLWMAQTRVQEQEDLLQKAYLRVETALRQQDEQEAANPQPGLISLKTALSAEEAAGLSGTSDFAHIFSADLAFPPGLLDLDAEMRAQIDESLVQLNDIIARIPPGREWLLVIDGRALKAADPGGVSVAAWEAALLRLGGVTDYLAAQGLPADQLAVRFQAGLEPGESTSRRSDIISLKLACCYR